MSLSQALSVALSGLRVNTQLISTASNNIANAQTDGYSAKSANLESVEYGSSAGGVNISSYSRASDIATTKNYQAAITDSSYYTTLNSYLKQVQTNFDSTSTNPALSDAMSQFASAWNTYAASPESSIEQNNLIGAGRKLAGVITDLSSKTATLDRQVQQDIGNTVSSLNSSLKKVASLNLQLQEATTSGQPTGDLQDKLDAAVREISQYTRVVPQSRANGQIALYTVGGTPLVDSAYASTFSFDGTNILDSSGATVTDRLTGGSLQAATDFRSTSTSAASSTIPGVGVISKIKSQLSLVVDALTGSSGAVTSQFATSYSSAVTTSTAATGTQFGVTVASSFFTVTNDGSGKPDPNTFAVTSSLVNGTAKIPQMNVSNIYNSFDSAQGYSTSGLNLTSATYTELCTSVITGMQQSASSISGQQQTTKDLQDFYKTKLSNNTGVNMDQELSNLIVYQNSYAASSKVISTVNQMFQTIIGII